MNALFDQQNGTPTQLQPNDEIVFGEGSVSINRNDRPLLNGMSRAPYYDLRGLDLDARQIATVARMIANAGGCGIEQTAVALPTFRVIPARS